MAGVAKRAIETYLAVQRGEQVVILVDSLTSPSIPRELVAATVAAGAEPILIQISPRDTSGENLPKSVLDAVVAADVVISACSRVSVSLDAQDSRAGSGNPRRSQLAAT
jgi:hypothetical protein